MRSLFVSRHVGRTWWSAPKESSALISSRAFEDTRRAGKRSVHGSRSLSRLLYSEHRSRRGPGGSALCGGLHCPGTDGDEERPGGATSGGPQRLYRLAKRLLPVNSGPASPDEPGGGSTHTQRDRAGKSVLSRMGPLQAHGKNMAPYATGSHPGRGGPGSRRGDAPSTTPARAFPDRLRAH